MNCIATLQQMMALYRFAKTAARVRSTYLLYQKYMLTTLRLNYKYALHRRQSNVIHQQQVNVKSQNIFSALYFLVNMADATVSLFSASNKCYNIQYQRR
jgi:hypothetical protein